MPTAITGTKTEAIDPGTMGIWRSLTPTPQCRSEGNLADLETSLNLLMVETNNFAMRFIADGPVRQAYIRQAQEFAKAIRDDVIFGRLSPYEGAREANKVRNELLETVRLKSSDIGRAKAEQLKATGKTLPELQEHYAGKTFKKAFDELSQAEKNQVWLEIVEASGRTRPAVNASVTRWAKLGRGLVVLSAAIAVYNIATAEDKGRQAAKEGATVGAGILGGMAGGAAMGLACGPGSPVCVTVGVFVGGVAAALGMDFAFDKLW